MNKSSSRRWAFRLALLLVPPIVLALIGATIVPLGLDQFSDLGAEHSAESFLFPLVSFPGAVVAYIGGIALGFAGYATRYVLQNDLAVPATLGVVSGAQFALILASSLFPSFYADSSWIASIGGVCAGCLVMALSSIHRFNSDSVILSGLVVSLLLSSMGTVVLLLDLDALNGTAMWQAGETVHVGFADAIHLGLTLMFAITAIAAIQRPLGMFSVGVDSLSSLGVPHLIVRAFTLSIAWLLTTDTLASVGNVGLLGLIAPMLVRQEQSKILAGALNAGLLGGVILLGVSLLAPAIGSRFHVAVSVSTLLSACAAILLLPLLLQGTPRLASSGEEAYSAGTWGVTKYAGPFLLLAICIGLFAIFHKDSTHWPNILDPQLFEIRGSRLLAAVASGTLLAICGLSLQIITRNPMASPDSLGLGVGAAMGVILCHLLYGSQSFEHHLAWGLVGSTIVALTISGLFYRDNANSNLIVFGVAATALFQGLMSTLVANGQFRPDGVLSWLTGSTYGMTWNRACLAFAVAILYLLGMLALSKYLNLMSTGRETVLQLGASWRVITLVVVAVGVIACTAATLIVGPITFVGLMVPHIVKALGIRRAPSSIVAAGFFGGALMVASDWISTRIAYPYHIPIGAVVSIIGCIYLMLMTNRQAQR